MCYLQNYYHFYGTYISVCHISISNLNPRLFKSVYTSFKLFLKSVWFYTSNENHGFSMDRFLYHRDLGHKRVKVSCSAEFHEGEFM